MKRRVRSKHPEDAEHLIRTTEVDPDIGKSQIFLKRKYFIPFVGEYELVERCWIDGFIEKGENIPHDSFRPVDFDKNFYKVEPEKGFGNLGVGGSAVLVGGQVKINLDELVDFFAGVVGLDPAGDDKR